MQLGGNMIASRKCCELGRITKQQKRLSLLILFVLDLTFIPKKQSFTFTGYEPNIFCSIATARRLFYQDL